MDGPHHTWDHLEYCDRFVAHADALAALAADVPLDTPVPTCPGWTLTKLLKHVGIAHAWAAANAGAGNPDEPVIARSLDLHLPDDGAALPGWLAGGARRSADLLRGLDPDAPAWAFGEQRHVRFWSRRMLHETMVHRLDAVFAAAHASGGPAREPAGEPADGSAAALAVPDVEEAADGVDELLGVLPGARAHQGAGSVVTGSGETIHLHVTDLPDQARAPGEWTITLHPSGYTLTHGHAKGDTALRGTASVLLLTLYRRLPLADALASGQVQVLGETALAHRLLDATSL